MGENQRNAYIRSRRLHNGTILAQLKLLKKVLAEENRISTTAPMKKRKRMDALLNPQMHNDAAVVFQPTISNGATSPKAAPINSKNCLLMIQKRDVAAKLMKAAPYYMFFSTVTDSKETHDDPLSITLQEILDKSLGDIEASVQINFLVDIGWLLDQYHLAGIINTPMLLLYGKKTSELCGNLNQLPLVTTIKINMPNAFSTSHAKMMLFAYKDGSMRVVVSTANLYFDDWHNRTQGIWISPRLLQCAEYPRRDSPTRFRHDLMSYLYEYKLREIEPWIVRIKNADFSEINVFFIGSVPGSFREGTNGYLWGHPRVGHLLQNYTAMDNHVPIICQSSSIGSLGKNSHVWIEHDFLQSFAKHSQSRFRSPSPPFSMIYPTYYNVSKCYDGISGGNCLSYCQAVNDKQLWLLHYLRQWSSKARNRTQALPHIKSYARFDLSKQCLYWFILTSANLSKAAWGSFNKVSTAEHCLRILNYEAGVLFLPRFVTGDEYFPLLYDRNGTPSFPLPYDVPLTAYDKDDSPFLIDYRK